MDNLFAYLDHNKTGIFVFIICLYSLMFLIKWFASVFALGRYKTNINNSGETNNAGYTSIAYIFADLAVKIINDFRHLLALVIVGIFGLTLAYVLFTTSGSGLKDALQAVIAAFGGIVGTIIGYYFGESAAKAKSKAPTQTTHNQDISQSSEGVDHTSLIDTSDIIPVAPPEIANEKVD